MRRKHLFILLLMCSVFNLFAQVTKETTTTQSALSDVFKPLKYRNIGPFRGGRSVCATGVIGDPLTYYMGTTGGGLWKTEDAGHLWKNISDGYFKTGSVGAVAVSTSDPNIVYVGMGEHAPRGVMTSYGDGVYKSTDAGKTWKYMGLKETQQIARIIIHPKNPNILYVAAQGQLNGPNKDRGIFKSMDGGVTWTKILYKDERTGCAELSMDLSDPNILYAAMWEHQRLPWKVISGGPGSGLYKSMDGGATWTEMTEGLPTEKGKMAIAVCQSNPQKVYALIESDTEQEKGGLFVSNNAGKSWSRVSGDHQLVQRAWYYIELFIDPKDENTVYVLSAPALRSLDGGKTWENLGGTHGDYHDLWINPNNPRNLCIANDGGTAISFNYGASWSPQDNMPTGQFYRINVDNQFPYRIYGGQQDNTSISIAHRELGSYGISSKSWEASAGGESAFLAFDPDNPRFVMGGSYLGTIEVLDNKSNAGTNIMAAPIQYLGRETQDMKYRFNWNAPIIWSQHEPNTFYHGAQVLLRTRDMGKTWEEVSPDLTRNEKAKQGKGGGPYTNEAVGAENYGTIAYVVESPQEKGVIWVGTDDGYVQVTRDNAKTWTNVTPKTLQECLVNAIEVSPHDPGTAYIATTRYKFNDHTPKLMKTTDYGKTWTDITSNIPYGAYTRVVREDPKRKDLLFAGTETGMYLSWSGGKNWEKFNLNLPVTPITDLMIKHDDLIVATMGRAFWILDDIELLRQYKEAKDQAILYQPTDAILSNDGSELNGSNVDFDGTNLLRGVNPANGIVMYYYLPEAMDSTDIELIITDKNGNEVRRFSSKSDVNFQSYDGGPSATPTLPKKKGLNRFVWNMRYPTMLGAPTVYIESNYEGHKASPGEYNLQLNLGKQVLNTNFKILPNPLYELSNADYLEYHQFMTTIEKEVNTMHKMVNDMMKLQKQLNGIVSDLNSKSQESLKKEAQELVSKMKAWDDLMVQRKAKAYDDVDNYDNKFTANYLFAVNHSDSSLPRVNQPTRDRIAELNKEWATLKQQGEAILNAVPALNKKLWEVGIGALRLD